MACEQLTPWFHGSAPDTHTDLVASGQTGKAVSDGASRREGALLTPGAASGNACAAAAQRVQRSPGIARIHEPFRCSFLSITVIFGKWFCRQSIDFINDVEPEAGLVSGFCSVEIFIEISAHGLRE